jgi:hypothetical protein
MKDISEPGIYTMTEQEYHADPCATPSLSNSIGHTLLTTSPRHAWFAHPKLNPDFEVEPSTPAQEEGTALHALILEKRDVVVPVDAADWRSKDAQAMRADIRKSRLIPVLAHRMVEIEACAVAVRAQLRGHREAADAFTDGKPEQVMVWWEDTPFGRIQCRALVDWLQDDPTGWIDDLKTVAREAEPGVWGKNMVANGYATQAAFYLRGARALGRQPRGFRFVVAERDAPYGVSVCTPSPQMMELGEARVQRYILRFGEALHRKEWPSYPPYVAHIEPKPWDLLEVGERTMREQYTEKGRAA